MHGEVVIQQLEYLVALARERHFGRAASACHVSQPTLSVAIRKLEHELDVVIVLRGQRFEGFTTEGQRIVTWANRILAERDELLADVDRMRGGLTVTARIGAVPTSVPASPLVTSRFLERYPGARVRVEALSSREIARRLAEFELDAGLTYLDNETPPGTKRVELYRERFVLVAPSDHPLMQHSEVRWGEAAELPLCALYTHIKTLRMASVVAHTWLDAFGMPDGLATRPMVEQGPGPAVGLIVLDREPNSLVAQALLEAAADAGRASP
jgi:DNA-binding transcriptional LysR family regulator